MAKLANSLRNLRDKNIDVVWPGRPREWDGWIGDAAHQQTNSDHNPNKRGVVDAIDIDSRQIGTQYIHVPTVIASALIHPSTHYVIHNKRIWSSTYNFVPHTYTGTNPHDKHIHVSIFQTTRAESSTTLWKFILRPMNWPTLKRGMNDAAVRELQAYLNGWGYGLGLDSDFGLKTETAVKDFQKAQGITVDGVVGSGTKAKLRPIRFFN